MSSNGYQDTFECCICLPKYSNMRLLDLIKQHEGVLEHDKWFAKYLSDFDLGALFKHVFTPKGLQKNS